MREGYVGQQGVPRQIPLGAAGRTDRVGTENLVRDMAQLVYSCIGLPSLSDLRSCVRSGRQMDLKRPEAPTDVRW